MLPVPGSHGEPGEAFCSMVAALAASAHANGLITGNNSTRWRTGNANRVTWATPLAASCSPTVALVAVSVPKEPHLRTVREDLRQLDAPDRAGPPRLEGPSTIRICSMPPPTHANGLITGNNSTRWRTGNANRVTWAAPLVASSSMT